MAWQLWVLVTLAAAGLLALVTVRMLHARHVFNDLVRLDRPDRNRRPAPGQVLRLAESTGRPPGLAGQPSLAADELARVRARHLELEGDVAGRQTESPHRKHG